MEAEVTFKFKYSPLDFVFCCAGLLFFVADIVLDVWAVVNFYHDGDFVYLGLLIAFLVGSSVLGQLFSWFWYRYEDYERYTRTERSVSTAVLKVLHLFQLGIYLRYVGVLEIAVCSFCSKLSDPENKAVFLSHDLALLRVLETFSESCPQLVLMLTVMLQTGDWKDWTIFCKAFGSASAIACSVTLYHRALRSFLPGKALQGPVSSLLYFIWTLLLIFPRLAALALFAHALPCYIFTHFLCSWVVLVFFAWRSKTDLMDSPAGEWLYRATAGLIWYFSWFNVVEGRTMFPCLLYHGWMLWDMGLLCGLACWQTHNAPGTGGVLSLGTVSIMSGCILAVYTLGILVKLLYYKFFHPKLGSSEPGGSSTDDKPSPDLPLKLSAVGGVSDTGLSNDEVDFRDSSGSRREEKAEKSENRRMKRLAQNFYS